MGGCGYGREYGARRAARTLYGRGGARARHEWAGQRGYDVKHTIQPRLPRR